MIIDPAMLTEMAFKTSSTVAPVPTVIPDIPDYVKAGNVGNRTLWYAFSSTASMNLP